MNTFPTLEDSCRDVLSHSPNQRPVFDHMSLIWTNERTGFTGKFYPKGPPFDLVYDRIQGATTGNTVDKTS